MRILFSYLWKLFQSQRKETSIIKSSPPSLDIQIRETEQSRNKLRPSPEGARQEKIPPVGSGRVPQDARPAAVVDLCGELVAPLPPRAAVKYLPGGQKRRRSPILYTNKGVNPLVDRPPPSRTRHARAIYRYRLLRNCSVFASSFRQHSDGFIKPSAVEDVRRLRADSFSPLGAYFLVSGYLGQGWCVPKKYIYLLIY